MTRQALEDTRDALTERINTRADELLGVSMRATPPDWGQKRRSSDLSKRFWGIYRGENERGGAMSRGNYLMERVAHGGEGDGSLMTALTVELHAGFPPVLCGCAGYFRRTMTRPLRPALRWPQSWG